MPKTDQPEGRSHFRRGYGCGATVSFAAARLLGIPSGAGPPPGPWTPRWPPVPSPVSAIVMLAVTVAVRPFRLSGDPLKPARDQQERVPDEVMQIADSAACTPNRQPSDTDPNEPHAFRDRPRRTD